MNTEEHIKCCRFRIFLKRLFSFKYPLHRLEYFLLFMLFVGPWMMSYKSGGYNDFFLLLIGTLFSLFFVYKRSIDLNLKNKDLLLTILFFHHIAGEYLLNHYEFLYIILAIFSLVFSLYIVFTRGTQEWVELEKQWMRDMYNIKKNKKLTINRNLNKLDKLLSLKEKGAITEEEYNKAKNELIK